ncbi:hypothetical protein [Actinophytocola sediminis]
MDDLAAALTRLAAAFPDDPGPAADPFEYDGPFYRLVFHGKWAFGSNEAAFVNQMLSATPRILRLHIDGPPLSFDEAVPARFVEAGWQEWPAEQRTAVANVLRTWWNTTLTTYPSTHPVNEVLVFLTQITGDVRPWLTTWTTIGGTAAAHQLRTFMTANLFWRTDLSDFDQDTALDAIDRWLLRDGIDILAALPSGPDLDAGLTELAEAEQGRWWLWWPASQLTHPRHRPR